MKLDKYQEIYRELKQSEKIYLDENHPDNKGWEEKLKKEFTASKDEFLSLFQGESITLENHNKKVREENYPGGALQTWATPETAYFCPGGDARPVNCGYFQTKKIRSLFFDFDNGSRFQQLELLEHLKIPLNILLDTGGLGLQGYILLIDGYDTKTWIQKQEQLNSILGTDGTIKSLNQWMRLPCEEYRKPKKHNHTGRSAAKIITRERFTNKEVEEWLNTNSPKTIDIKTNKSTVEQIGTIGGGRQRAIEIFSGCAPLLAQQNMMIEACSVAVAAKQCGVADDEIISILEFNGASPNKKEHVKDALKGSMNQIPAGHLFEFARENGIDISNPNYKENQNQSINDKSLDNKLKEIIELKPKIISIIKDQIISLGLDISEQPSIIQQLFPQIKLKDAMNYVKTANGLLLGDEETEWNDYCHITEEPFIVKDVVYCGLNFLVSEPGCGKTRFLVGLINHFLTGAEMFACCKTTKAVEKNRVLIYGVDQQRSEWWRLLKEKGLMDFKFDSEGKTIWRPNTKITLVDKGRFGNTCLMRVAKFAVENKDNCLIIFDTFAAMRAGSCFDENSVEATLPLDELMHQLPAGTPIVVSHHANKDAANKNAVNSLRGSSNIAAIADRIIYIKKKTDNETDYRRELKSVKRGGSSAQFTYLQETFKIEEVDDDSEAPPTKQLNKKELTKVEIINALCLNPEKDFTNGELWDIVKRKVFSKGTFNAALKELSNPKMDNRVEGRGEHYKLIRQEKGVCWMDS